MAVNGNFGDQSITLNNAAEESTLRDILNVMSTATRGGRLDPAATQRMSTASKSAGDSILKMLGAANRSTDSLEDLTESHRNAEAAMKDFRRSVGDAAGGLIKSLTSDNLENATKGVLSSVNDMIKSGSQVLPPGVATGLTAAATVVTGVLGYVEGAVAGFTEQFDELANGGFIAGEGIGAFSNTLTKANVTASEFSNLIKNSGDDLRSLGGSVSQGARQVVKLRAAMRGQEEQFTRLGYSYAELSPLIAEYSATMSRGGRMTAMSDQEVIKRTANYATNLRILSDLTGKNVKELKAEADEATRTAKVQGYLTDLEASGRTEAFEAFGQISAVLRDIDPQYAELFADRNTKFNTALSDSTALIAANNPVLNRILGDLREGIANGTITEKNAREIAIKRIQAEEAGLRLGLRRSMDLATAGIDGIEDVGKVRQRLEEYSKTPYDVLKENAKKQKETQDEVTQAMVNFKNSTNTLGIIQNSLATSLSVKFGSELTGAVDYAITKLREFGDATIFNVKTNSDYLRDYESMMSKMNVQPGQEMSGAAAPGAAFGGAAPIPGQAGYEQNELYKTLGQLTDEQLKQRGWKKIGGGWGSMVPMSFQKMATGGVIPNMGPEGMPIRAGDGVAEAVVPLPNGRSIPVEMKDNQSFKDMNSKLDLVASINRAMLDAMEENNRLVRQGNNLVL